MRFKELRLSNNLSQKALGEKLDISQQRISLIELQKTYPNSIEIKKYAVFFHVSSDYVLGLSQIQNEYEGIEQYLTGGREQRLLKYYSRLTEEWKQFYLEILQVADGYQKSL